MGQNFMAALAAEIAELEGELDRDIRFVRLRELRKIMALYVGAKASEPATIVEAPAQSHRQTVQMRRVQSPERARALALAKEFVGRSLAPVPTREILEFVLSQGVVIAGNPPLNNLSAMLSSSDEFKAEGRSGWRVRNKLAEPPDEPSPDDQRDAQIYRDAEDGNDEAPSPPAGGGAAERGGVFS
ncbi:hypothetical protein [Prosthecodimorpha staleyi]|uniref:Uncharacterized protein n=1 Tax=Prosthecodimorpha staleyi TaxID=2840188 RepID=A0A947GBU2_9HYPH|nr:hypothetical protein [Prosthecodimorpha staleyi]MBT9288441.1 hypothetical protein [Prosthecodimorpha staleyi]